LFIIIDLEGKRRNKKVNLRVEMYKIEEYGKNKI
jgi:hypothetical protein